MRRIYLVIFLFLIALAFLLGLTIREPYADLQDILSQRDSISIELKKSLAREEALKDTVVQQKKAIVKSDSLVAVLEQARGKIGTKFHKEIKKIDSLNVHQLDSFFIEKYPELKYVNRPSFNASTKPVVIYEWRAKEIAKDRIRLDSISAVVNNLDSTNTQLRTSITDRDALINTQNKIITEKDSSFSLLLQRETTYARETFVWKGTAKKYKRQRNVVIAGVAAVVVGGVIYSLKR